MTSLFSQAIPTGLSSGVGNAGTNGLHFTVSASCTLEGIWHYSPSAVSAGKTVVLPSSIGLYTTQASPSTGTVVVAAQTANWLTGPGGSAASAGSGWVFAPFSSPPTLSSGTNYMAAKWRNDATDEWFVFYAVTWPVSNTPLTAPKDAGTGQGWFDTGTPAAMTFPGTQLAGDNWGMDVEVSTSTAHTDAAAESLTPSETATGAHGHSRTATLAVTPSESASGDHPRTGSASLGVAPSESAQAVHGHSETASLAVTPSESAQAQGGAGASLGVAPSETAAAAHGHSAQASLTVTPVPSAQRKHAATKGISLAVTPSETAAAAHGHTASASESVTPGLSASGSSGNPAHTATAALAVTPVLSAATPFPAPETQLDVRLELNAGGTWTDVTADADHGPWTITRGHPDESTTVSPATFSASLTNKTARYSPDNVMSDLWPWCVQNMPLRASIPAARNYLRLEADDEDRAYVDDNSTLHVTSSLDLRIGLRLSDWQGCVLAARLDSTTPSWYWLMNSDGTMSFSWYDSGGTQRTAASDAPVPFLSGDFALRVVLDATVGTLAFYTSDTIGGTWTVLGDAFAMTGGAATSVRAGNAPLVVGYSFNIGSQLLGRVYEFQMRNGIGGSIAADGLFSAQAAGTASWADSAGNTWNLAGGAELSGRDYRGHFESSEWPQDEPVYNPDVTNKAEVDVDALVPLVGGGLLRRYSQRAPNVQSAMYRAILALTGSLAAVQYWPMEDAASATVFGSATGGAPMTWTGGPPALANSTAFACSGALPSIGTAALQGQVPFYAGGTAWSVTFLAEITVPASNQVAFQVNVSGGLASYVVMIVNSDGTVALTAYAADGVTQIAATASFAWPGGTGQPLMWQISAQPSGARVQYSLTSLAPGTSVGNSISATSTASGAAGTVTLAAPAPWGTFPGSVFGHVFVQAAPMSLFNLAPALDAHLGEAAGLRFARLCGENGIACRTRGNLADTIAMGVQPAGTLTTLLQACADADAGVWTELRQVLGWGYVTRKALYNQVATAVLSYLSDHLSMWTTAPTRDDQVIVNDATYTNDSGSSVRLFAGPGQLISGGRMSAADPKSGGIGTYAQTYSVSVADDSQLSDLAGWRIHIGTVDQARLPGIVIDLANKTAAAILDDVLDLDLGGRLVIGDPPRRLGFEPVTQLAQALTETLFYDTLTVGIAGVPELPYEVVQLDAGMHLAPPAAILSIAVDAAATSWRVAADSGSTALWSTNSADCPQDWICDGERITVTAVSGVSDPQTATVIRSVNGVSKSHAAEAAITMWPPPAIGL